jgi:hypothetical protein
MHATLRQSGPVATGRDPPEDARDTKAVREARSWSRLIGLSWGCRRTRLRGIRPGCDGWPPSWRGTPTRRGRTPTPCKRSSPLSPAVPDPGRSHPAGLLQQARDVLMDSQDAGRRVRFLIRDRDTRYTSTFDAVLTSLDTDVIKVPVRVPVANAREALASRPSRRVAVHPIRPPGRQPAQELGEPRLCHRPLPSRTRPTSTMARRPGAHRRSQPSMPLSLLSPVLGPIRLVLTSDPRELGSFRKSSSS